MMDPTDLSVLDCLILLFLKTSGWAE